MAHSRPIQDVIQARRIELVDRDGAVTIVLDADYRNGPTITLRSKAGEAEVAVCLSGESAQVSLRGGNSHAITLQVDADGWPSAELSGPNGQPGVVAGVRRDGGGFRVYFANGVPAVEIEATGDGSAKISFVSSRGTVTDL